MISRVACNYLQGGTALLHAFKGGHVEVVRLLLDAGADLNVKDSTVSMVAGICMVLLLS